MNTKNNLAILVGITAVAILFASAMFIIYQNTSMSINQDIDVRNQRARNTDDIVDNEWQCLKDNEEAGYYNKLGNFDQVYIPQSYPVEVIVRDKNTKEEVKRIKIENIRQNYYPAEVKKCGIYVMKSYNYNPKKSIQDTGYKVELYKYDYNFKGESLVLMVEKPKEYISYYSTDFRVSPDEKYVALIKSYGGQDDYSLVIKDLKTKEDAFILTMNEFLLRYPDIEGSFDLIGWKSDGRYFWADIMTGAPTPGYLRVDSRDWSYEAWETPEKALGGFEPNYMTGWMPYAPSAVWTGMVEMDEAVRADAKAKGQISPLYIYNLFTKKQIKIDEVQSDPIWNFGPPTWLSDAELEYQMPDGEKKTYKLK